MGDSCPELFMIMRQLGVRRPQRVLASGLTARMMAECIPGAAWAVDVTDASANPAAASPSRYSARDSTIDKPAINVIS
jgi:hypothetical protein